jgi:hypothetical protein
MVKQLLLVSVAAIGLSACTTNDPTLRGAGRGAAIGAAGGAVVGAVVDGVSVGEGAAAGAVAGGVIGAATADGRRYYRDGNGDCYYIRNDRREYVSRDRCQ